MPGRSPACPALARAAGKFGRIAFLELPSLNFTSGYVQRSIAKMPKQGSKRPWRLYQNYALDIITLRYGKVDDGVMQYS
jgi:hypothetical protein